MNRKMLLENAKTRLKSDVKQIENATGFKIDIDTLTGIKAEVTKAKFYEVRPSEFMPVVVGENAWASSILTYRSQSIGSGFEAGLMDTGSNAGKGSSSDVQVDGIEVPAKYWRRDVSYNLAELNKASKSGNWSLIEAKEESRFRAWQLGIQQVAFLGLKSDNKVEGLLTQSDVAINTALITVNISDMTATQFQAFVAGSLGAYSANCNSTAMPDTLAMPQDDYLGLGSAVDEGFGMKSRLERLQEAFRLVTRNPSFEILPLAYAMAEHNADFLNSGSGFNRYVLYKRDDRQSLRMDIPVDYVSTIADTINGFDYQSVGYGGFTGAKAYRPKEVLYFDHSA